MNSEWIARLSAHPRRRDAAVAGFWALLGVVLWALGAYPLWGAVALMVPPPWVFLALLAAIVGAVTLRSRAPFTALLCGIAVAAVDLYCGGSLGVLLVLTDLIYAAMKYGSARRVRLAARVGGGVALGIAALLLLVRPAPGVVAAAVQCVLVVLVSALWGWNVRSEGERTRLALTAAHAAETTQLRDLIAHELHDLVANQIAVAGLHVEAAKLQLAGDMTGSGSGGGDIAESAGSGREADRVLGSLDRAKRGTDEAHRELRRLIAVLTEPGATPPAAASGTSGLSGARREAPGDVRALDELLPGGRTISWGGESRAALEATLRSEAGERGRVLLRVLRELITNAAKHGTGDASVRAEVSSGRLIIEVRNAHGAIPRETSTQLGGAGTGLGLGGARRLVTSIGGDLNSAQDAAGWGARISVPVTAVGSRTRKEPA